MLDGQPTTIADAKTASVETMLDLLAHNELERAIRDGYPPRNEPAFVAKIREEWAQNEEEYLRRAYRGVWARHKGIKLTGWRWVRGEHSGDYVNDPWGQDRAPSAYSHEHELAGGDDW